MANSDNKMRLETDHQTHPATSAGKNAAASLENDSFHSPSIDEQRAEASSSVEGLQSYNFYRYPDQSGRAKVAEPEPAEAYLTGDEVYVKLRSQKDTGAAVVLQPVITDPDSPYCGRILVRYDDNGSTCHVRPAKIVRVNQWKQAIVFTGETEHYRQLARTQVGKDDFVVDIGSSYGVCTHMLSQRCARAVGIDISNELIAISRETYPDLQFECFDAIQDVNRLKTVAAGCNKVFIDIGGDRAIDALVAIIPLVESVLRPDLIVVKNRKLKRHIDTHLDVFTKNGYAWWEMVVEEHAHTGRYSAAAMEAKRYPLRYPIRFTADGVNICRFHNYDECLRLQRCEFNHTHCHHCGEPGHRALECAGFLSLQ